MRSGRTFSVDEKNTWIEKLRRGMSIKDVAKEADTTYRAVWIWYNHYKEDLKNGRITGPVRLSLKLEITNRALYRLREHSALTGRSVEEYAGFLLEHILMGGNYGENQGQIS